MIIRTILVLAFMAAGTTCVFSGVSLPDDKLDSLRMQLHGQLDDSVRVELYIQISRLEHRGRHREQDCFAEASAAVELAATLGNTLLYAKSMDNLGLLYRYHQYYAEAVPLHQKAFDMIEKLPDAPLLSKMIFANNTGVAARHNGDDAVAVKYYLKSLAIATKTDDKRNMEIASSGIGIVLMNLDGREGEGLAYMQQALEIAKEEGNKRGQAMHHLSIGGYYDERGEYELARHYFRELASLNEELSDKNGLGIASQALGTSFLKEGENLQEAEQFFQQARIYFSEASNEIGLGHTLFNLGEVRYRNGRLPEALAFFEQAMAKGLAHSNKNLIRQSSERMAQVYEDQNDARNALKYYKTAQLYKDSIARIEQETAITAIKRQFDFENKEGEIRLLTNEKLLKEAELERRSLTIYLMSGVVVLLLGLVFFQIRIRRLRKRAQVIIARQQEEKVRAEYEKSLMEAEMIATRMQVNPHFMFNSLSAIKYMIQNNESTKAERYLVTFSRFIRKVLETSEQPIRTVAAELELLADFLKLEANRFEGDFEYHIHDGVERWADRKVVPAMLLQPFVENAVWHGLLPSEKPQKKIAISAASDENGIVISIEDNGVGFVKRKTELSGHTSMGHRITDKRIELYNKSFADRIDWEISGLTDESGNMNGTRVQLTIRIEHGSGNPDYTPPIGPSHFPNDGNPAHDDVDLSNVLADDMSSN